MELTPLLAHYNSLDVLSCRLIWDPLVQEAKELNVYSFYNDRVLPLARAVHRMAARGLLLDRAEQKLLTKQYATRVRGLRKQLPAGVDPDSPTQVRKWLYGQLGLPQPRKRTKWGGQLSVDEETLRDLYNATRHEALATLLAYREASKVLSTYLRGVRPDPDGRVRCRWLVHGTATGRFASRKPNLQNVPKEGRRIYIAPEGKLLGSLDYDQIELRIMAHLAQDGPLLEALAKGIDVHGQNARELFQLKSLPNKEDPRRLFAKVFIYGVIMYGGSPRTIKLDPQLLEVVPDGRKGVARLAEVYYREHPGIERWRGRVAAAVRRDGKLYNWAGRVRVLFGHLHDRVKQGCNYPIQSGAADIVNQALVAVDREIPEEKAAVIGQHHDAFLVECVDGRALWEIKAIMERPIQLEGRRFAVPVSLKVGTRWSHLLPPPKEK